MFENVGLTGSVLRCGLGIKVQRLIDSFEPEKGRRVEILDPMEVDIERRDGAIKLRIRASRHRGNFSRRRYVLNLVKHLRKNGVKVSAVDVWGCYKDQPKYCDEAIITCPVIKTKKTEGEA